MRRWKTITSLALSLFIACSGESGPTGGGSAAVDRVVVTPDSRTTTVGQQVQFGATAYDRDGNALSGRTMSWASSNTNVAAIVGDGVAEGRSAGSSTIHATSESVTGDAVLTVNAPPSPPPPPQVSSLSKVSGDNQSAPFGAALATPFTVRVADQNGSGMNGITVVWSVTDGNGSLSSGSSTTDASGDAQSRLTLGATLFLQAVTATVGSRTVTFAATGNGSGSLQGRRAFPTDNEWNRSVAADPVDPSSTTLINTCGATRPLHPDFGTVWNGAPNGIPYIVIRGNQPRVPVSFQYAGESDPGPYPVPPNAPIEGGPSGSGDRHVLLVDWDNWRLYEMFASVPQNGGQSWQAGSGAIFDLSSNALRPAGWTSADAAGLPIFPGLVRYDEVAELGEIRHALRFTCPTTRRAYVHPARHWASSNTSASQPPMGMRVRLKASYDISTFAPRVQVILRALKSYGMFLADNGSAFYLSGAPDPRWNDDELRQLRRVMGSDFEVVRMGTIVTP